MPNVDVYKRQLVQSEYKAATDEVNKQCTELNKIIKSHDKSAMLIGEAPCTKDLITITDKDFKVVSAISIIAIFIIIAFAVSYTHLFPLYIWFPDVDSFHTLTSPIFPDFRRTYF